MLSGAGVTLSIDEAADEGGLSGVGVAYDNEVNFALALVLGLLCHQL